MTEQLQEMKARLEAATPGPWMKDPDEPVHIMKSDKPGSSWDGTVIATLQRDDFGLFEEANADLIAHAPETQAKLIAALEAVEEWAEKRAGELRDYASKLNRDSPSEIRYSAYADQATATTRAIQNIIAEALA